MRVIARFIATVAFVGRSPWAPGTMGAGVALVCLYLLTKFTTGSAYPIVLFLLPALLAPLALWASSVVEKKEGKDSQSIVVDEFLGQWVTFLWVPQEDLFKYPFLFLLGFLLFRVLDITKILGIARLESLKGGVGIIADDLLAGIYASLGILGVCWML